MLRMIFICLILLFVVPSVAHADLPGYPKGQRTAEKKALSFAKKKYDITGISATCERVKRNWKCDWVGMTEIDEQYEPVHGRVLVKKRGYTVLKGMRWGYGI